MISTRANRYCSIAQLEARDMSKFRVLRRFVVTVLILTSMAVAAPVGAATVEYVHTDSLGSVVALSNQAGQVTQRREYEPYGDQISPAKSAGPGYTGHVTDEITGLSYMEQRYYDPVIGRFLSVDPVAANPSTGASFNRYRYAANNPYLFTDPDGRNEEMAYGFGVGLAMRNDPARLAVVRRAEIAASAYTGDASSVAGMDLATTLGNAVDAYRSGAGFRGVMAALGVVYLRTDPKTGEKYVGQAKSDDRYDKRQGEHDKKLGTDHRYTILERAEAGEALDVAEERQIRANGGIQREGGTLANKRHQMSESRFRGALGRMARIGSRIKH